MRSLIEYSVKRDVRAEVKGGRPRALGGWDEVLEDWNVVQKKLPFANTINSINSSTYCRWTHYRWFQVQGEERKDGGHLSGVFRTERDSVDVIMMLTGRTSPSSSALNL